MWHEAESCATKLLRVERKQTGDTTGKCRARRCSDSLWTRLWWQAGGAGRGLSQEDAGVFPSVPPSQSFCSPQRSALSPRPFWTPAETARWWWASAAGPGVWVARPTWWPWRRASWEGTCSGGPRASPSSAAAGRDAPSRCPSQTPAGQWSETQVFMTALYLCCSTAGGQSRRLKQLIERRVSSGQ